MKRNLDYSSIMKDIQSRGLWCSCEACPAPAPPARPCSCTGPAGPMGPAGADGKSAYEIAVEQGFSGTEEEWLASLTGPAGPQGDTGPAGPPSPFARAYGTFISNTENEIEANGLVPFDTAFSVDPVGIAFTPGAPIITIINAGVYQITYGFTPVNRQGIQYALYVNGAVWPGSTLELDSSCFAGFATLELTAGSTIAIIVAAGTAYLGETKNAVLSILRVDDGPAGGTGQQEPQGNTGSAGCSCPSRGELAVNGGMEAFNDNIPVGWTTAAPEDAARLTQRGRVHSGASAVNLKSGASLSQIVPVHAGCFYELSFFVHGEGAQAGLEAAVTFITPSARSAGLEIAVSPQNIPNGDGAFAFYRGITAAAPAGAVSAEIRYTVTANGNQSLDLDDVSFSAR